VTSVPATEIRVRDHIRFAGEVFEVIDVVPSKRDAFIRFENTAGRMVGVLMSGSVDRVFKATTAGDLKVGDAFRGGIVTSVLPCGAHWIKVDLDRLVVTDEVPANGFILKREEVIHPASLVAPAATQTQTEE
jgi:hypothetical protein